MSFCVNMHGVILNSYDEQWKTGQAIMPGFTFFTFKLVLSEDFSKDKSIGSWYYRKYDNKRYRI